MSLATRLFYTAITFGMLCLAFVAYQMVAVPLLHGPTHTQVALKPRTGYQQPTERYDHLLAPLFPANSWQREQAHVLKSDQLLLLIREWEEVDASRLRIWPCTMVFRSKGFASSDGDSASSGRTWILDAPEGATIELEDGADVQRGDIGKVVRGFLQGQVRVTSQETRPGAGDAVQFTTANLHINAQQIATTEAIDFTWGPHREKDATC